MLSFLPSFIMAMEPIQEIPVETTEVNIVKNSEITQTRNNYGVCANHSYVEPQFLQDALSFEKHVKILEIGPAEGRNLKALLNDPRNKNHSFTYHFAELCELASQEIYKYFKAYSSNSENKICEANRTKYKGDARPFLENTPQTYDLILCCNVLHYFNPVEQIKFLKNIHRVLNNEGKAYILQSSILSIKDWTSGTTLGSINDSMVVEDYKENIQQNDLWPGYFLPKVLPARTGNYLLLASATLMQYRPTPEYIYPTLHTLTTFKRLLETVGFNILDAKHFAEAPDVYSKEIISPRVGAIIQKNHNSKDLSQIALLGKYEKQALKKVGKLAAFRNEHAERIKECTSPQNALQLQLKLESLRCYIENSKEPDETLAALVAGGNMEATKKMYEIFKQQWDNAAQYK